MNKDKLILNENNTDPRTKRTHEAIKTAFEELISENEMSGVNVSKVAERAEINRKTFYLHYDCIEDLFDETIDKVVEDYARELDMLDDECPIVDLYPTFYRYITKQETYVERIVCDYSYSVPCERLVAGCAAANRNFFNIYANMTDEEQALFGHYIATNMFYLYRRWIELGKQIPVDHLTSFAVKLLHDGMAWTH